VDAEFFPKSDDVRTTPKKMGRWLRLFGKHWKRARWAEAWDGEQWLRGRRAIASILSIAGHSPDSMGELQSQTSPTNERSKNPARPRVRGAHLLRLLRLLGLLRIQLLPRISVI